jgi:hypothetical protein
MDAKGLETLLVVTLIAALTPLSVPRFPAAHSPGGHPDL